MKAEIFLGLLVILSLFQASVSSSYGLPEGLSDTSLLSSVGEAKQLVDAAYKHTRNRIKEHLQNDALTLIELLGYFTQPVAGTRAAVWAADYMETTLTLLKEKLRWAVRGGLQCHRFKKCQTRLSASPLGSGMDQQRSLMFMQWGLFIDHDLDFSPDTPARVTFSGKVDCHTSCAKQPPCFPIKVQPAFFLKGRGGEGDSRANEMLEQACMHTLFVREHNRLARGLKRLNPHWNGKKLYQEARKILGAMIQIITYRDYLPLPLATSFQRLIPHYWGYNESVDPQISNVFTLAFCFAHASVPPTLDHLNLNYKPRGPKIQLRNAAFAVWRIVKEVAVAGGIDPFLQSLMANQAKLMTQQQMVVDELQDRMSEQVERIGFDLSVLNMQRSRDHGLPGYNSWRQFCGLSQPSGLKTLVRVLRNHGLAKKFIWLYGTQKNIDIWIGALAEPIVNGGRGGPLMACLIGTQFRNVSDGDRFWWENRGVFTPWQCSSLAKISLSRIICDNTHMSKVPRHTFWANRYSCGFVSCSQILKLDLKAWKSKRTKEVTDQ
ncbi:hypothetical protein QYF61_018830, partial [Mycteria americana]